MARDYTEPVSAEIIEATKKELEKKGFAVEVLDSLQKAHDRVIEMIPEGSEVFTGTSVTLDESGLTKELNGSGRYVSVRDKFMPLWGQEDKKQEMRRLGSVSDFALGSVHAITQDGQVFIASRTGSQLPNYVFGADKVIWIVGAQKIVADANEAFDRVENYVLPLEDKRAQAAYGSGSEISKLLIYRTEAPGRITILLVNEAVGY